MDRHHSRQHVSYADWEAAHHYPSASSRPPPPEPAESDMIGFLDLPNSVRTRIYELAIHDHDRTAVFLPRAVPRKVEPCIDDVDVVLTEVYDQSVIDIWKQAIANRLQDQIPLRDIQRPDTKYEDSESTSGDEEDDGEEDGDQQDGDQQDDDEEDDDEQDGDEQDDDEQDGDEQDDDDAVLDDHSNNKSHFDFDRIRARYRPNDGPYFLDIVGRNLSSLVQPVGRDGSAASGRFSGQQCELAVSTFESLRLFPAEAAAMTDDELLRKLDEIDDVQDTQVSGQDSKNLVIRQRNRQRPQNSDDKWRRYTPKCWASIKINGDPTLEDDSESLDTDPECSCCASSPASSADYRIVRFEDESIETKQEFGMTEQESGMTEQEVSEDVEDYDPEENWVDDDRNVFTMGDHDDFDDSERFDADDCIGMLYEPREPSILFTCKEIRAQCLPIYYKRNQFSWRFLWKDYERSCRRFKAWTQSVGNEHIKLISGITFQGKHIIEEGLEYSVDIDILGEEPFFETRVYADEDDGILRPIVDMINYELAEMLWLVTQDGQVRPIFTQGLLCKLAIIFIQGMHRDASGVFDDGVYECREALSTVRR